jgi:hypothetical protein
MTLAIGPTAPDFEAHRGDAGMRARLPDHRRRRLQRLQAVRDAAGEHLRRPEVTYSRGQQTVRNVFVIGPDKKVKLILVSPMTAGRNFDEVLRVVDSLQLTVRHRVATPVNWRQGEDVIIAGSASDEEARSIYLVGWKALKPSSGPWASRGEPAHARSSEHQEGCR